MNKVVIAGGGAAGMAAAIGAAQAGCQVVVYEKNEKLGKKIYITGKGRCNVTNSCDTEDLFSHMVSNGKFLYSAIYGFSNFDVMGLMGECGCPLKIERGNRVFPVSDKSSDVIAALERRMKRLGVSVRYNEAVKEVVCQDGRCLGVVLEKGRKMIEAGAVIVATGGLSYPATGSTGDGYRFAEAAGHTVTELSPALVPFTCAEEDVKKLQGLSLKNVEVTVYDGKKVIWKEFGEMLFTHFGVSGPLMLSASSFCAKAIGKTPLKLSIDLKPALTEEQLDKRILREFDANHNKQFKNAVDSLFPAKLKPVMTELSGIAEEKKVNEITKEERMRFVRLIKDFKMTLTSLRSYSEAIITKGGVSVKEIHPGTMESKFVKNLYFSGEVLDLDALTGGYNLQIAWSTAYLAGMNAGREE